LVMGSVAINAGVSDTFRRSPVSAPVHQIINQIN
jgi:hypothetical protein